MKRFLFTFMAIMFFVIQGWSQTPISNFPWTEGFETTWSPAVSPGNAVAPNSWLNINKGGLSIYTWLPPYSWVRTGNSHSGIANAEIFTYLSQSLHNDWLITPQFTLTGNERLRFWARNNNNATTSQVDEISIWISNENLTIDTTGMGDTNSLSGFTQIYQTSIPIGDWQQYEIDLSQYSGNRYIAFVRRNEPYSGYSLRLDDVEVSTIPTCIRPSAITVSNIQTTSVNIAWTNGTTNDNSWKIYYKQSSATNWDSVDVSSNPYTLQGLNPSSAYNLKITTNCGSEFSEETAVINFRTACGAIASFPWTEGFESAWTVTTVPGNEAAPNCWINLNGGYNSSNYKWSRIASSNYLHTGTGAATMNGGYSSNSTYINSDWLISPTFTLQGTEMLNFYTKSMLTFYPEDISIYILDVTTNGDITSAADTSHFVRIMTPELQTTSWLFHELPLPYTGDYRIAFVRNARPGGGYLCLDDITISEMPSCPNTYNLTSTLHSATSVDLNWMQNGNGSGWVIAYGNSSTFDTLSATTITITSSTTIPYTVTGLTPQTPYSFAVRQNCAGSTWSNIVSTTTPAIAATLPYSHDFENITENGSWTFINGAQTNKWVIGTAADTLGTNGLYISNDQGVTNAYTVGTSRVYAYRDFEVPAGARELELSFDWRAQGGVAHTDFLRMYLVPLDANITVGVIPPNGLDASAQIGNYTGGTGEHWLSQSTAWQHKTMRINSTQFPNLAGRTWRLLVHWRNESSTTTGIQPPAAVDNINLSVVACAAPSALTASNITTTSALLTWTENGSATNWIIEYKPSSATTWNTYQTTSNPDSIINLIPGTSYTARLRSLCTDTSLYSNTITFQTVCAAQTVSTPVEGFLTAVPPTSCWAKMQGTLPATGNATLTSTTSGWFWDSHVTPHNAKISIYTSPYYPSPTNYWLISPSVDLGNGNSPAQIEFDIFYTATYSTGVADTSGTDDRFAVVVSTDDGLTWNATNATIWSNATGATRVLNNIPNTPTHIILPLFDPSTTLPYTGNIKIGFYGESTASNANNDLHIDNFEVLPYSICQLPTNITATATATDASVSFTENGSSTSWEYVYGDAITITDPTTGTAIATTTNTIQLTGLTPQTQYNIWVRSICDNGNSEWSSISTFVTEALPVTLPYTCDFESATENLAWKSLSNGINKWAIDTAAGNGNTATGTQANYISNDNGVSYATTFYNNVYSYTYRDIDFGTDPASYNLSFDWKCQGYLSTNNTLYAGLRVYLRDPSDPISTSGLPTNPDNNLGSFYNAATWQNAQLPIDNISGIKRLIFVYFDPYYNQTPPAAIDNISLVQVTCLSPDSVLASNLTTTTADISWVHTGADSYIVSYRVDTTNATVIDEAAITSTYTIQGLTSGTRYIVSVRAICGSDTTIYSSTITFQTPCFDSAISQFPYIDDFSSGIGCWISLSSGTSANGFWQSATSGNYPTTTPHSPSNMLYFNTSTLATGYLISSEFTIPALTPMAVDFWMVRDSGLAFDSEYVEILVNSTQSITGATSLGLVNRNLLFTPVETTNGWHEYLFTIPDSITGSRYFIIKAKGSYGYNIYVDDFSVISLSCPTPQGITISNITSTSADVSWTIGGSETTWQVCLDTIGTHIDVNTNPQYQLQGLTPSTAYTIYVRANCGGTYSSWVSQTFTTSPSYQVPTVTTIQETGTTQTSTNLNGSYIQGSNQILVKGFQWKLAIASSWTTVPVSAGTSPFVYGLNGLTANTQYEFRAYVETSLDTTYGSILQFTTLSIVAPTLVTNAATSITQNIATLNGTVTPGTEAITAQGFEWRAVGTSAWTTVNANGTTITYNLTTLTANTVYEFKAFATTASGNVYGTTLNFTTLPNVAPTVLTDAATSIAQTTATLNGAITLGTETITAQGFEWRAVGASTWTTVNATGTTITHNLTGLTANAAYEFKAFATTASGNVYGTTLTFTTLPITVVLGEVTTQNPTTPIADHNATLNGTLVSTGNAVENIELGFVYSTITNPVIGGNNVIIDTVTYSAGMTTFSKSISGLLSGTNYYCKAYITNSAGTAYGEEKPFLTAGLNDVNSNKFSVSIFPNPATNSTLLVVNGVDGETDIVINDAQGKLIYKTTAKAVNGKVEQTIDVNNFAKGVYYVRIKNQTTSKTQKLIVID